MMSLACEIGGCLVLASCFFGGVMLDTAFWRLHSKSVRKRLDEMDDRQRRNVAELLPLAEKAAENVKGYREEINELRALVDAHIRKDDAGAKMMALALADRIDALSARMDAVELKTGLREKAKTAGGVD